MAPLPKERVTPSRPFTVTGVDFAGPIFTYLKIHGKAPYKSYIAVFICFATKAVHLEAVTDLTSDPFIAALKRFVGRRGIEFSFIPPRAPHFGGLWEAAVKTAKGHLYRTLSNAHLTFEELTTSLVEIEAIMNSRPLTATSTNPNDFESLTPAHFLIGTSLQGIPEPFLKNENIAHAQRWQRISAAKTHFWKRWQSEYLADLQNRYRWKYDQDNVAVGNLVIIYDEHAPPMKWVMGRIVSVKTGADGRVRVADVQTPTTVLRRPVAKLALIPIN
ncbi:uncharacterized protein LOC119662193 [Teleopsis dalmanni]|nr:uncharacterized protein LOC119662193 [Teleopsis dalmanni]